MKWVWIIAAVVITLLFLWPMIYGKQLPDIFRNQENAPTIRPHHWLTGIPTAKGQIEIEKISITCFPITSPT